MLRTARIKKPVGPPRLLRLQLLTRLLPRQDKKRKLKFVPQCQQSPRNIHRCNLKARLPDFKITVCPQMIGAQGYLTPHIVSARYSIKRQHLAHPAQDANNPQNPTTPEQTTRKLARPSRQACLGRVSRPASMFRNHLRPHQP
jgi:hypothetical protein